MNETFETFQEAASYVEKLRGAGVKFQESRIYADRLNKPNPGTQAAFKKHHLSLLGMEARTAAKCLKLAPGGKFRVEIETPGSEYQKCGILGMRHVKMKFFRASVWYTKYLPYAVAMMNAEWHFPYPGINFESVNSYYGTCMGYQYLLEEGRIEEEDRKLYDKLSGGSYNLPFDEVFFPAMAFVAVRNAKLFLEKYGDNPVICKSVNELLVSGGFSPVSCTR